VLSYFYLPPGITTVRSTGTPGTGTSNVALTGLNLRMV
jgi:hypothetical protein